jgi:hypothetical protein
MRCKCGGTGFVTRRDDFRTSGGTVHKGADFVKRCPEYLRYFRDLGGAAKFIVDVPVAKDGEACPAAIDAHRAVKDSAHRKQQEWEQRRGR